MKEVKKGIICLACGGDTYIRRTRREKGFIHRVRLCKICRNKAETKES